MKRYIWLIRSVLIALLFVWIGMLHFFSAQPADVSSSLSEGICYRIAQYTVADFEQASPEEQAEIVGKFQTPVRKAAHFCEYALGGFLALLFLNTFALLPRFTWLLGGGFGLINAILDELHQSFVAGRGPGVGDVLLDLAGFLVGMAFVWITRLWWRNRRRT